MHSLTEYRILDAIWINCWSSQSLSSLMYFLKSFVFSQLCFLFVCVVSLLFCCVFRFFTQSRLQHCSISLPLFSFLVFSSIVFRCFRYSPIPDPRTPSRRVWTIGVSLVAFWMDLETISVPLGIIFGRIFSNVSYFLVFRFIYLCCIVPFVVLCFLSKSNQVAVCLFSLCFLLISLKFVNVFLLFISYVLCCFPYFVACLLSFKTRELAINTRNGCGTSALRGLLKKGSADSRRDNNLKLILEFLIER